MFSARYLDTLHVTGVVTGGCGGGTQRLPSLEGTNSPVQPGVRSQPMLMPFEEYGLLGYATTQYLVSG